MYLDKINSTTVSACHPAKAANHTAVPVYCSASGGSFWDRPPGCASYSELLRLRRKLLRSSTRMRLLFWIQSGRGLDCSTSLPRGGLDLSQQSPKSAQGGAMEQSSRWWAKICHFGEVGHWSRSLAAFFFRKFLGNLIDAHLRCERRRTFTVRTASSTITFTQDTQKHR